MLKKTLFAAAALIAATTAFQPVQKAEAGVNIGINLGLPGVYAPGYYGPAYVPAPVYVPRVSYCRMARRTIRNHGYYKIRAVDCSGSRYTFHAKRGGIWYRLRVKARSGYIYKVTYL